MSNLVKWIVIALLATVPLWLTNQHSDPAQASARLLDIACTRPAQPTRRFRSQRQSLRCEELGGPL